MLQFIFCKNVLVCVFLLSCGETITISTVIPKHQAYLLAYHRMFPSNVGKTYALRNWILIQFTYVIIFSPKSSDKYTRPDAPDLLFWRIYGRIKLGLQYGLERNLWWCFVGNELHFTWELPMDILPIALVCQTHIV